jgi:DNA topoisomerase-1
MVMPSSVADLTHKEFLKIDNDPVQSAECAALTYVKDNTPGIIRLRKGKGFCYMLNNTVVKDKAHLQRIKKLAIPPAWKNVWICTKENGHIQATGIDLLKRKQYRYHSLWNAIRKETKFHRLYEFGKVISKLRAQTDEDMSSKELTERKVIATVVSLMERTYIRVGNLDYEKLYGSYGLTTLKDKHVII